MDTLGVMLGELLEHEFELAHSLSQALAAENDALQGLDPAALDKATDAKQQCVSALSDIESERRLFCAGHGMRPDSGGMHALCVEADGDNGPLITRWYSLLALLETCREANQRNGAIVSAQRRRVDGALGLLYGSNVNATVYDAQGEIAASDASHVHAEI